MQNVQYWQNRQGFQYYYSALRYCCEYMLDAESILDVGPHNTSFIQRLSWIPKKTTIDLSVTPPLEGVEQICGDFLKWKTKVQYDLVVCLQVLEHLKNPAPFAKKLLKMGKIVVVSVPYLWAQGECEYHLQDPVDMVKLESWFGRSFLSAEIVSDLSKERLIAVFSRKARPPKFVLEMDKFTISKN